MNFNDRVQETTTTAGTGTISLAGAVSGFASYDTSFPTGTQVGYCVLNGVAWEVGYGTLTIGAPSTLSRDYVLTSTNSNALISLTGASATVFCTIPADEVDFTTVSSVVGTLDAVVVLANRKLISSTNLTILGTITALGDIAVL
jgi:hypothetical protein